MPGQPTLILDVMGAELGAAEMVRGAAQACAALRGQDLHLVLVTAAPEETERLARQELASLGAGGCEPEILAAPQQLPASFTSPVDVFRKYPECSIRKAMDRAKDHSECVVVSPGTTGLVMTAAMFTLGRVPGIDRVPIGTPLPTRGKQLFFVDGGANVDCKPRHLYQFAVLAHLYVQNMLKVERPSIALLSNGSEEYKGTQTIREAYDLLAADRDLNFTGYTEGHTVMHGDLDIMVCDGFLGNVLLKFAEGVGETMFGMLREELKRDLLAGLAAKLLQRRVFKRFFARLDYTQFGGAPLLGLNGNVVICHGRSPARAIKNALLVGYQLAKAGIALQVAQYLTAHPQQAVREPGTGEGDRAGSPIASGNATYNDHTSEGG